jgi:hypothetical protein
VWWIRRQMPPLEISFLKEKIIFLDKIVFYGQHVLGSMVTFLGGILGYLLIFGILTSIIFYLRILELEFISDNLKFQF